MNCDEVIRELAVPTGDHDPGALAGHIAHCPTCALWAQRANQLDRLWELTRPAEPSSKVWNSVWMGVTEVLESASPAGAGKAPMPSFHGRNGTSVEINARPAPRQRSRWSRRWGAIGLIGLAQAAAILLAVTLTWRFSTSSPTAPASDGARADFTAYLEIEEGHLVVIRWDDLSGKVEDRTPDISDGVDDWLLGLNAVEALADVSVALKE
jgi:hypothetical protein